MLRLWGLEMFLLSACFEPACSPMSCPTCWAFQENIFLAMSEVIVRIIPPCSILLGDAFMVSDGDKATEVVSALREVGLAQDSFAALFLAWCGFDILLCPQQNAAKKEEAEKQLADVEARQKVRWLATVHTSVTV